MKRITCALAALVALAGCAGLSVNFDAYVTYRSDVPQAARTGQAASALPAAAPAASASK